MDQTIVLALKMGMIWDKPDNKQ